MGSFCSRADAYGVLYGVEGQVGLCGPSEEEVTRKWREAKKDEFSVLERGEVAEDATCVAEVELFGNRLFNLCLMRHQKVYRHRTL